MSLRLHPRTPEKEPPPLNPIEKTRLLPGDDLIADAKAIDTRGIDIAAAPSDVWPWLVQMGYGRAGWYSYDQLDMNKPSADRIIPELQDLEIGEGIHFRWHLEGRGRHDLRWQDDEPAFLVTGHSHVSHA